MMQSKAPLWEALVRHKNSSTAQLHIPGHRAGGAIPAEFLQTVGKDIFEIDLTEIPGLDDLHNPAAAIAESIQLTAELFRAEQSFWLVNGTSCGLIALILACCNSGDKIILPRNAHRSVVSGLILSGAVPVYYQPEVIEPFSCLTGPPVEQIKLLLKEHQRAKAVLAVHPTYYGILGDLTSLAEVCHQVAVPLLVDEAHGSHLRFHPALPADALSCGADATVQSFHKTGGSLTQSSLLHLQGKRINRGRLADALRMVQSTSPSYLLMASLDLARRQLALQGEQLLKETVNLAHWCRDKLCQLPGVMVLGQEHLGVDGAKYLDTTRLSISLAGLGLTGYQAAAILHDRYGVVVEMADYASVVAVISLGTTLGDGQRLVQAITELARLQHEPPVNFPKTLQLPPPVSILSPREAWQRTSSSVPLEKSVGCIAGETVAVYPPGIPVICPGEEITPAVLDYLLEVREQGIKVQGAEDGTLQRIRVIE